MAELSNCSGGDLSTIFPDFKDARKSSMGETYRYLNNLIKGKSMEDYKNIQDIVSAETLSLFDTRLQLMIVNSFQLKDEVIRIILSQDDVRIKQVLQCRWFFKNLPSEFCIKKIFPYVSLSLRCKIINKLSKHLESTEEAEKYFLYIREVYDNDRADYLLPRCSPEFIVKHVKETKSKFESHNSPRVLLNICHRYPQVGIQIISEGFANKNEYLRCNLRSFKKVLHYLVGHHLNLFVPFFEKYHSELAGYYFGNKSTKNIARKIDKKVLDSMKKVVLKEKPLFLTLDFEDKVEFIARLVRFHNDNLKLHSWKMTDYTMKNFLELVPPGKRLEMVKKAFNKVYNLSYDDYSVCWTSNVLKLLPLPQREPYVFKIKEYLKDGPSNLQELVDDSFSPDRPEDVVVLQDSKAAFEELKNISRFSPTPSKREKLLRLMVETCSINNNTEVLQQVIDYVTGRCRNEEYSVVATFTQTIHNHFPVFSLTLASIEKIIELRLLFEVRFDRNGAAEWKGKRIYHYLENNMEVEELVTEFFESYILPMEYSTFLLPDSDSEHAKTLFMKIFEKAVDWMNKNPDKEKKEVKILETMIFYCNRFNRGKKRKILLENIPGLSEILRKHLSKNFGDFDGENWPLRIYDKLQGKVFNGYYKDKCILYALKNEPALIDKYLSNIYKYLCTVRLNGEANSFLNFLTLATSFYGKTDAAKEILRSQMTNEETQMNAIKLFSHFCTVEEFCEAIQDFLPEDSKVQVGSQTGHVQMSIPRIIKNIKPRWKNVDLIFKFYFGDFLKPAQTALNSWAHHARSDFVLPFLVEKLAELPPNIAYRKNILRLIVELSARRERLEFCLKFWNEYEHYSIRSILLKYVNRAFFERPTREEFKALEKCILESDKLTIESRPEFSRIPKEFVHDYVAALWKFSEALENYERKNFRQGILRHLTQDNINDLKEEFVESIIRNNLFEAKAEVDVNYLVIYFMMRDPKKTHRARTVFHLINERKPSSSTLDFFLRNFIALLHNDGIHAKDLLAFALSNWPEYPSAALFEVRLLMTYKSLHVKVLKNETNVLVELGKELKQFLSTVENLADLASIYAKVLKEFFAYFNLKDSIEVTRELVGGPFSRTLAIIGILSLRGDAIEMLKKDGIDFSAKVIETKRLLSEAVTILKEYNDEVVDIYLKSQVSYYEDQ